MTQSRILVLATGGTIAGTGGSPTARDYRPGQIAIEAFLEQMGEMALDVQLTGRQIAAIGSENMGQDVWNRLHRETVSGMADPACDGIVITHGTDTVEETALLLDETLPSTKPVVLVGAMRAADAVGSDGLRNFTNAVRVAGHPEAAGRGVLVGMGDRIFAARDVRKAATRGIEAFRGFPRDAVGMVTPHSLDWFGAPWRTGEDARRRWHDALPDVALVYIHAGIGADAVARQLSADPAGIVVAGVGEGNMPDAVRTLLAERAKGGTVVVRASRADEGLVDREGEDEANRFVAARALNPQKAVMLVKLLIADGIRDPAQVQAEFDRR
ncbi:asparaginase [Qipengyuania sp. JC766]|uniref:asparaginase n=1 Tax=Qipengyuania sp. JC766 TaxID=3232139 RepID=UPI003459A56B